MKKTFLAVLLASVAGSLCAQAPAADPVTAQPAAEAAAAPAIKVDKIVTAAGVDKKEPVNESSAFGSETSKVYTWTRIVSETVPVKVKHVYYLAETKVGEIEIPVNGSPWRIWSAKNVRPGNWKVDVTDESGKVLASLVFTVADAAQPGETPAAAPKAAEAAAAPKPAEPPAPKAAETSAAPKAAEVPVAPKAAEAPPAPKAAEAPAASASFEIAFQKTAASVTIQSATGVDWKETRFECKALPCRFFVDKSGVTNDAAKVQAGSPFAFSVEMAEQGVTLKSVRGTEWTDLQYSCIGDPCKFVVDTKGVRGYVN